MSYLVVPGLTEDANIADYSVDADGKTYHVTIEVSEIAPTLMQMATNGHTLEFVLIALDHVMLALDNVYIANVVIGGPSDPPQMTITFAAQEVRYA